VEQAVRLQSTATVLTIAVSALFLVRLWREAELHGAQEVIFGLWFVIAAIIELLARGPLVWIVGLVAQLLLAVTLVLKDQMDNIY
jgi:hypothetical protein